LDIVPGAVPALAVVDSLARGNEALTSTVERENLWRIQTPQAFHFDAIYKAHREWTGSEPSDDARMLMALGQEVRVVAGDERLAKFTFASDFAESENMSQIRSGTGFDVHRLVAGEELWLCGIRIPHDKGLAGHSDADVAMHALTDAILGAMALGDIGDHFPPSDAQWRGASSDQFLVHAMQLAHAKGYRLANADVTIICEAPKIGSHKLAMRKRLAEIMDVDIDLISVKATTTEMLGFTGRGEGIAAQAVASFEKSQS
jgi:2-C-methyl-D-erythritol 4-phosphate cytidylyltransferase / 2-C-methyl-D-erythritol 2,4-cyclodiphosphate synthase